MISASDVSVLASCTVPPAFTRFGLAGMRAPLPGPFQTASSNTAQVESGSGKRAIMLAT
jgi:hypothetical protein